MENISVWKNNKLSFMIIILFLLFIFSFQVMADNGNTKKTTTPPSYKVSPPVVVLKVTPADNVSDLSQKMKLCNKVDDIESQDYLQKKMTVEWYNNNNGDSKNLENDLKFEIEDDLTLNNSNSKREFGLNTSKNSENTISSEYILVKKKNDNKYFSLDNKVKILDSNSDSSELDFKLDPEIFEDHNWQNIEAGVYKGHITPNIELPGNSNKKLKIIVIIDSVVNIDISEEEMKLVVEKPVEDKSSSVNWSVNTNNSDIKVKFESTGIELKNNKELDVDKDYIDYSNFFRYHISNGESFSDEFSPAGSKNGVSYTGGKLKLKYSPNKYGEKKWCELLAGKYEDTVIITVSEE